MERASIPALHPALLPPGTVVGPWRVVAWAGRGVYGAVYRAVPVQDEHASPVALKLALHPGDPRFAREGELLSRVHHLSIPRLLDAGEWVHPGGTRHPYIAMEWIDGVPLYQWAQQLMPSSQQVLQHLAQLAGALHALHARGGVHRDVKGENVLVRRTDSRAVLTDLGSGSYSGASTLTPPLLIPGTPAYRSPEAWLFELRFSAPRAPYSASPADDIYALGVTAYRLVTGEYPELAEPFKDDDGVWQLGEAAPISPLVLNPRVEPRLSALILRMLSVHPEQRGTTAEWAETLEQAARLIVPQGAQPIFAREAPPHAVEVPQEAAARSDKERVPEEPSRTRGRAERTEPPAQVRQRRSRLPLATAGLALITWAWWVAPSVSGETPAVMQRGATGAGSADAGTAGLGEAATAASTVTAPEPDGPQVLAEDPLPEPVPGQARPNNKGRCPAKGQVALNKVCWVELPLAREGCEALALSGHMGQMFKSKCYVPAFPSGNQPTSSPANKP